MISLSDLDRRRFGHVTAKVEVGAQDDLDAILRECRERAVRLLIARCSTKELRKVQEMEAAGFQLTDTLVYWRKEPITPRARRLPAGFSSRAATATDAPALEQAAAAAFHGYDGHYHADPRLDPERCDEVYSSWASSACTSTDVASHVLLITSGTQAEIAGFAALKRCDASEFDGVLFGVHPAFHRQGLFHQLLELSQEWGLENGYRKMLYSTQLTNVVAQRALCAHGFEPVRSRYTLHKWLA